MFNTHLYSHFFLLLRPVLLGFVVLLAFKLLHRFILCDVMFLKVHSLVTFSSFNMDHVFHTSAGLNLCAVNNFITRQTSKLNFWYVNSGLFLGRIFASLAHIPVTYTSSRWKIGFSRAALYSFSATSTDIR